MHKPHNPDDIPAFKPPHFLFYYVQRISIWGQWSLAQARYDHRRALLRYQQQQEQSETPSDDDRD